MQVLSWFSFVRGKNIILSSGWRVRDQVIGRILPKYECTISHFQSHKHDKRMKPHNYDNWQRHWACPYRTIGWMHVALGWLLYGGACLVATILDCTLWLSSLQPHQLQLPAAAACMMFNIKPLLTTLASHLPHPNVSHFVAHRNNSIDHWWLSELVQLWGSQS